MAAKPDPVGFFSYVHDDDAHEGVRLKQLHARLVGEVGFHIGRFEIFFDRQNIRWGQQWRERIDGSIASSVFLFPVIAEYFQRPECRRELERFLDIEKQLGSQGSDLSDLLLQLPAPERCGTAEKRPSGRNHCRVANISICANFASNR